MSQLLSSSCSHSPSEWVPWLPYFLETEVQLTGHGPGLLPDSTASLTAAPGTGEPESPLTHAASCSKSIRGLSLWNSSCTEGRRCFLSQPLFSVDVATPALLFISGSHGPARCLTSTSCVSTGTVGWVPQAEPSSCHCTVVTRWTLRPSLRVVFASRRTSYVNLGASPESFNVTSILRNRGKSSLTLAP